MGGFVFFGALLGLLAIAFAVSALWQRAPRLAVALAIGIPLAVGGLYWLTGRPAALDPKYVERPKTVAEAVVQLERAASEAPKDFETQVMLGRSYMATGKFSDAANAYARAMAMPDADAEVGVEYAEALLRASADSRFPSAAVAALEAAAKANPQNQRALFFLGLQRLQSGQPAQASVFWERLLPMLEPAAARAMKAQLVEARVAAGLPPLPESAFLGAPGIDIEVGIDPTLAGKAAPGDTLFVFAREAGGAGPPLAVKRIALDAFPLQLRLGDADSPMPAAKLSSASQVVLQARLSKSGTAEGASGDFEADPVTVDPKSGARVSLVLTRTRP